MIDYDLTTLSFRRCSTSCAIFRTARRLMCSLGGGDLVLVTPGPARCVCRPTPCASKATCLCDSPSSFSVLLFCFCCCQIKKKQQENISSSSCLLSSVSFFLFFFFLCFLSTNFLISSARPKHCPFQLPSSSSSPLRSSQPPRANH